MIIEAALCQPYKPFIFTLIQTVEEMTDLGCDLPPGCLREVVDVQLLLVAFESLASRLLFLLLLRLWPVPDLGMDLLGHLLRNSLGLKEEYSVIRKHTVAMDTL